MTQLRIRSRTQNRNTTDSDTGLGNKHTEQLVYGIDIHTNTHLDGYLISG